MSICTRNYCETFFSVDLNVPYQMYISALICEDTFELYNESLIIQRSKCIATHHVFTLSNFQIGEIVIPTITSTVRTTPTTFDIILNPSAGSVFEIAYFRKIGTSFDLVNLTYKYL